MQHFDASAEKNACTVASLENIQWLIGISFPPGEPTATPIRILDIAGSLRRDSYNRSALRAATKLTLEGAELEIFELNGIPLFNQDDERTPPAIVVEFKKRIREADAILIVTPEYNHSIPGSSEERD